MNETIAEQARMQEAHQQYEDASNTWQKAEALLPVENLAMRASYLRRAGCASLWNGNYVDALSLYKRSIDISREIGDKAAEGATMTGLVSLVFLPERLRHCSRMYIAKSPPG